MSKEKVDAYTVALHAILKENSENGEVTVSYNDLVEHLNWNKDTIFRCMTELMKQGKITRIAGGLARKKSTYRIK